jgi:hypothetical protein
LTNNKYFFYLPINHLKTGILNEKTLTREKILIIKFKIEGEEGKFSFKGNVNYIKTELTNNKHSCHRIRIILYNQWGNTQKEAANMGMLFN